MISRHFLDNVNQPTVACICQSEYSTPLKYWHFIQSKNEVDKGMVEVKNDLWFRDQMPEYIAGVNYKDFTYTDERFTKNDSYLMGSNMNNVFSYANNEPCSCAFEYIDSTIGTDEFKINLTYNNDLRDTSKYGPCTVAMEDYECYYEMRKLDTFDLLIENVAKDGCIKCYSMGSNLWPKLENQLIDMLTRSFGDDKDCSPKHGYHKSTRNEIYRCEPADHINGTIAFTEADGETGYECGIPGTYSTATYLMHKFFPYAVIMVSI